MNPVGRILLTNLVISVVLGTACFLVTKAIPPVQEFGFMLFAILCLLLAAQALACWVVSIVFFVRRQANHGLGFLLSGFMVLLVGFGTCASMMVGLN